MNGVKFRGTTLDLDDVVIVRRTQFPLASLPNSTCWSQSQNLTVNSFRADVLSLLPMRMDAADNPTGKRLVNTSDLAAQNPPLPNHTVTLPVRTGNQPPESAGASLVVVYRTLALDEPLRKVVIYDGFRPQLGLARPRSRPFRGSTRGLRTPSAKITHVIASGQPNNNDRIRFNGTPARNRCHPFWQLIAARLVEPDVPREHVDGPRHHSSGVFGETVTTTVDHSAGQWER